MPAPNKRIKSISFLLNDKRISLLPDDKGKFKLTKYKNYDGKTRKVYVELSADRFVKHKLIKNRDPVLTRLDGYKIRVYQGGDPSYMLAESGGIILEHDNFYKKERKERETDPFPPSPLYDWGDHDF